MIDMHMQGTHMCIPYVYMHLHTFAFPNPKPSICISGPQCKGCLQTMVFVTFRVGLKGGRLAMCQGPVVIVSCFS